MTDEFRPWFDKWLKAVVGPFGLTDAVNLVADPLAAQNHAKALFRSLSPTLPAVYSDASLLHPERSPVPFGYRDDDLKELGDWCHGDAGGWVHWKLVTGETGRGKTRLLMRLVQTLDESQDRPWFAGFLDMTKIRAQPEELLYFYHLPGDLLFVVDYAERFEPEVRSILKASLALADVKPERRVRVVLISRRISELWKKIADSDMEISDFMGSDCFSRYEPSALGRDASAREIIFDDAYAAFERHFGEPRPLGQRPNLNRPGFEEVILIHLAALSFYQGAVKADEMSEETLLDWMLVREKRHWNKMIENRGAAKNARTCTDRASCCPIDARFSGRWYPGSQSGNIESRGLPPAQRS